MIEKIKTLSMAESLEDVLKTKDSKADVLAFIKKFTNLKPKEAKEFRKKIETLDLMKINENHTSKIIDIMPETAEELNKIFTDVGLNEDEAQKILKIVKEFE
ncbi:MAG: hypothetical protein KKF48_03145 [Nanoarchaeota archaeon]|nr:hypothetical protein [Nanoarchaeota archaeon]MBU1028019.1 hypothetical protein [Nanoarchaeota archaeon]